MPEARTGRRIVTAASGLNFWRGECPCHPELDGIVSIEKRMAGMKPKAHAAKSDRAKGASSADVAGGDHRPGGERCGLLRTLLCAGVCCSGSSVLGLGIEPPVGRREQLNEQYPHDDASFPIRSQAVRSPVEACALESVPDLVSSSGTDPGRWQALGPRGVGRVGAAPSPSG